MEVAMPSRRHSSAMLSAPRRPSSTMRILFSAENWRRVARRISLRAASAGSLAGPDVCFIFAPGGYDEPEILRSRQPSICLKGADAGHVDRIRARSAFEDQFRCDEPTELLVHCFVACGSNGTDQLVGELATERRADLRDLLCGGAQAV